MDEQNAAGQGGVAPSAGAPQGGGDDVVKQLEQELADMGIHAPAELPLAAPVPSAAAPSTAPAAVAVPPTSAAASTARVEAPAPTPEPVPSVQEAVLPAGAVPAVVPPAAAPVNLPALIPQHNEAMGQMLANAIQQGKDQVPEAPDPLVAKPAELESWRVFKIMAEFVEGFDILRKYGLAASIFGSARRSFADRYYDECTALAGKLAKSGFAIITGGSAGIMEAANKGAFEAGGASVGLNIRLDESQGMNEYLTDSMTFEHFFVRKVMLTFASEVYIYFPGGFGTLDEFTEIITLVQTQKIRRIPIVLYGREYWEPFTKVFEERLRDAYGAVDAKDIDLYKVVDTVDEAHAYIMQATGGKDVR